VKEYDKITENKKPLEIEKMVSKAMIIIILTVFNLFNFLVLENTQV
jgi:hypothetical protein